MVQNEYSFSNVLQYLPFHSLCVHCLLMHGKHKAVRLNVSVDDDHHQHKNHAEEREHAGDGCVPLSHALGELVAQPLAVKRA